MIASPTEWLASVIDRFGYGTKAGVVCRQCGCELIMVRRQAGICARCAADDRRRPIAPKRCVDCGGEFIRRPPATRCASCYANHRRRYRRDLYADQRRAARAKGTA